MKDVMRAPSMLHRSLEPEGSRPKSRVLEDLAGWLFTANADRWRRRAQFYERHRDYFPRLASGAFVDRCRELESASREFALMLFAVPPQRELVPIRVRGSRVK